jgi:hypothetical protein
MTAKPMHMACMHPTILSREVSQSGQSMPSIAAIVTVGAEAAMLALTSTLGITVARNNATAAMMNTKRRILSKAIPLK